MATIRAKLGNKLLVIRNFSRVITTLNDVLEVQEEALRDRHAGHPARGLRQ